MGVSARKGVSGTLACVLAMRRFSSEWDGIESSWMIWTEKKIAEVRPYSLKDALENPP